MLLTAIEKLKKHERDSFKKAREAQIIHKEPLGINKRDEL